MIEVDYKLIREEGNGKEVIFTVDEKLKKIDNNVIYIQAENAKGKSAYLDILGLAFYGDQLEPKDCRITASKKSDLEYMAKRTDQKFTYNITLQSLDKRITLISSKDNPSTQDHTVKEIIDGKESYLPLPTFKEKYFLIYDFPDDPLNRVPDIVNEVKGQQNRYHEKIKFFQKYLSSVSQEIADARDQKEIDRIIKTIEEKKEIIKNSREKIQSFAERRRIITSYYCLREFADNSKLALSYEDHIETLNKETKKQRKNKKRFTTQYGNTKKTLEEKLLSLKNGINDITKTIRNITRNHDESVTINNHIKKIGKIRFDEFITKYKVDNSLGQELIYFDRLIRDLLTDRDLRESGKIGLFYKELLNLLESNKELNININIRGWNTGLDELISQIKAEYGKIETQTLIRKSLISACESIQSMVESSDSLQKDLDKLKLLSSKCTEVTDEKIDDSSFESELHNLHADLDRVLQKIETIRILGMGAGLSKDLIEDPEKNQAKLERLSSENSQYRPIFQLDETYLKSKIDELTKQLKKLTEDCEEKKRSYEEYKGLLKELENKEPHKFQDSSLDIDRLNKVIDKLDQKFIEFEVSIQKIADSSTLKTENEIRYNKNLSYYFARKIPEFPYIGKLVQSKKIDFLNKMIYTKDERIIKMRDISTGQSMSMYVRSILNRPNDDDRKLLVIFDEVSTMDSKSFEPIKKLLKEKISENKIIFAVFAKAIDNDLVIKNLI